MQPSMIIVAGPPGSGKSTMFPVNDFDVDSFNADDRAAALNAGSYLAITESIRSHVSQELEAFVVEHISTMTGFAIETTHRTDITFNQAQLAKSAGFRIKMLYLAAGDFKNCLRRVIARAHAGGHSAPATHLQRIYDASLQNLPRAIREMDEIQVFDSSVDGEEPKLVLEAIGGKIEFTVRPLPAWLAHVLTAE